MIQYDDDLIPERDFRPLTKDTWKTRLYQLLTFPRDVVTALNDIASAIHELSAVVRDTKREAVGGIFQR